MVGLAARLRSNRADDRASIIGSVPLEEAVRRSSWDAWEKTMERAWCGTRCYTLIALLVIAPTLLLFGCGCSGGSQGSGAARSGTEAVEPASVPDEPTPQPLLAPNPAPVPEPSPPRPAAKGGRRPEKGSFTSRRSRPDLIQPDNIVYLGAFRLPGPSSDTNWEWSGGALTYNPEGDPQGGGDGFPGSLFGVGHDWQNMVSEISIPRPTLTEGDLRPLQRAKTLRPFTNIKRGRFGELELPSVGLEYLTGPQGQTPGVLHYCWGQHFQEGESNPSHGWVALDLSDSRIVGPWRIGSYKNYATNDYIFEIPAEWATKHAKGMRLATGRFREGGQGGRGPGLIAYDPYNGGEMARRGGRLPAKALILYSTAYDGGTAGTMDDYQDCDEWTAGAWLTSGPRSAVIFIGTKAERGCWYGWRDGTRHPNPGNSEGPGDRGFWATEYVGTMLFYDPSDLAAVIAGRRGPRTPQPYASLNIDQFLNNVGDPQRQRHVRGMAFDRGNGLMYILEFRGDDDMSLIHVLQIQ